MMSCKKLINGMFAIGLLSIIVVMLVSSCHDEDDDSESVPNDDLTDDDVGADDDSTKDDDDSDDDSSDGLYSFSDLEPLVINLSDSISGFDFDLDSSNRAGACLVSGGLKYLWEEQGGSFSQEAVGSPNATQCAFFFDTDDKPNILFSRKSRDPRFDTIEIIRKDNTGNWELWTLPENQFNTSQARGGMHGAIPYFVTDGPARHLITYSQGSWAITEADLNRGGSDYSAGCGKLQGATSNSRNDQIMFSRLSSDGKWQEEAVESYDYEPMQMAFASNASCDPNFLVTFSMQSVLDDDDDSDTAGLKGADSITLNFYTKVGGSWAIEELYDHVSSATDILVDEDDQRYIAYGTKEGEQPPVFELKMAVGTSGSWQEHHLYSPSGPMGQIEMLPGSDLKIRMLLSAHEYESENYFLVYLRPSVK